MLDLLKIDSRKARKSGVRALKARERLQRGLQLERKVESTVVERAKDDDCELCVIDRRV